MRRDIARLLVVLSVVAGACSGGVVQSLQPDADGVIPGDALPQDAVEAVAEVRAEVPEEPWAPGETRFEVGELVDLDTLHQGGFGWPCEGADDCLSGLCVQAAGGKVCTMPCADECPAGWTCAADTSQPPDILYLCMPLHVRLCIPCEDNAPCNPPGIDMGGRCVTLGAAGSFCGGDCLQG
ncbi:MAG: hypothetical protein FJ109_20480, partial [Deltaproteobacteria bacterium]|nr:hypothetical protein [Deltaproteobacteria bacterium]